MSRLSTEEVAARSMQLVATRGEELLAEYTRRFGTVLGADNAAELFPDYSESIDPALLFARLFIEHLNGFGRNCFAAP